MNTIEKCKYLKELGYTYNPETGDVCSHKGKLINKIQGKGYIQLSLKIGSKTYSTRAHQFAFYMTYGFVPKHIDHINRVKNDNRIINLRETTIQQNSFNTNAKGCSWHIKNNKFSSQIRVNNKLIHLGYFESEQEAKNAYLEAKKIYHIIK